MIVVTGGTGLVGGNLLWHLLQENDRVIAIRRLKSNMEPLRVILVFILTNLIFFYLGLTGKWLMC